MTTDLMSKSIQGIISGTDMEPVRATIGTDNLVLQGESFTGNFPAYGRLLDHGYALDFVDMIEGHVYIQKFKALSGRSPHTVTLRYVCQSNDGPYLGLFYVEGTKLERIGTDRFGSSKSPLAIKAFDDAAARMQGTTLYWLPIRNMDGLSFGDYETPQPLRIIAP